jgi:hypothetical protein
MLEHQEEVSFLFEDEDLKIGWHGFATCKAGHNGVVYGFASQCLAASALLFQSP